jgi:predicted RND superfamily exporter protein
MSTFSEVILRHRKAVIAVFVLLTVLSLVFMGLVTVNYKLSEYLPKDAQSTKP